MKKIIIFFLIALLAIFLSYSNNNLKNLVSAKLFRFADAFSNGFSSSFKIIFSVRKIYQENEKLKQEVRTLSMENIKLKELEDENKKLKTALYFDYDNKYNKTAASVVGRAPSASDDILIIDKGINDGVLKDGIVVNYSGELVGIVNKVDKDFSEVRILTDRSFSMASKIQNTDITGALKGVFGSVIMDLILPDKEIKEGSVVLIAGPEKNLFGEIPVGVIEKIISSPAESVQKAKIRPFVDLNSVDYVFVLNFK